MQIKFTTMDKIQYMNYIYHRPGSSAYLSGETALFNAMKLKFPAIKISEVRNFLAKLDYYNVLSEKNKNMPKVHPKFITTTPFQSISCDLGFFKKNKNIILFCQDDFSGFKMAQFIGHKKNAKSSANAMRKILSKLPTKPAQIRTDQGGEFANFKKIDKNIKHVSLNSFQKAYNAEKLIGEFRKLYRRYQEYTGRKDVQKILPKLINSMNKKKSRITKMAPIEAIKIENAGKVFKNKFSKNYMQRSYNTFPQNTKYKKGDKVRVLDFRNATEEKSNFDKKKKRYSSAVFTIKEVLPATSPQQYLIEDSYGKIINRRFIDRHLIIQK